MEGSAAFESDEAPTVPEGPTRGAWSRAREAIRRELPLRIILVTVLVALVAGLIYAGVVAAQRPNPVYATASMGNVILSTQASGVVQITTYSADFAEDGTLQAINVTLGQPVHAGQTLATLNPAPFQSALSAAQSASGAAQQSVSAAQSAQSQAESALSSAQSALSTAQTNASDICSGISINSSACNAAHTAVAQSQAQADAASARVAAVQAQLAQAQASEARVRGAEQIAQAQLNAITLMAPHDGIVVAINGRVGGKPGATQNGSGTFITLADTNAPTVTTQITYPTVRDVHIGDMAEVKAPQATNQPLAATVTGVSPISQGSDANLSYPVYLTVMPSSLHGTTLLQGMSADIRIITAARYHVITVPRAAVVFARESAPASGTGVLTKEQVEAALATAQDMAQKVQQSGFDTASDPITPYYLVGFANDHYVPIPVVLGLTDGHTQEVVAGVTVGQQVVVGRQTPFGF